MPQEQHPITPPPELVQQWQASLDCPDNSCAQAKYIAARAARWGADQELEACCEWLETGPYDFSIEATAPSMTKRLRAARRPKPSTLKQQALEALQRAEEGWRPIPDDCDTIRRALEALPDD